MVRHAVHYLTTGTMQHWLITETVCDLFPQGFVLLVNKNPPSLPWLHKGLLKSSLMERRALALKAMVKKRFPKKENLDPRKWVRQETVRGFADFVLNKDSEDTDNSFDNKEMCEYSGGGGKKMVRFVKWRNTVEGVYIGQKKENIVEQLFELHCVKWCTYIVWHQMAVFISPPLLKAYISSVLTENPVFNKRAYRSKICDITKCDTETWSLQCTHTQRMDFTAK